MTRSRRGSTSQIGRKGVCRPLCGKGSTSDGVVRGLNARYTVKKEVEHG